MARLKGAKLILKLGTPAEDFAGELTSWRITNEDKDVDVTTFADVEAGDDRDYFLNGTAVQDLASDSFWTYVWENSGEEGVPFTLAPYGNAAPDTDTPHIVGTLTIGPAPEAGTEAGKDNTGTFDFQWKLDGKPTLDRTAPQA